MGKTYVHWLKITAHVPTDNEVRQYAEIQQYLARHPQARAEIYRYDKVLCNRAIRLVCDEGVSELELNLDSGSNSLHRLSRKPKRITFDGPFSIPKWIMPYVLRLQEETA